MRLSNQTVLSQKKSAVTGKYSRKKIVRPELGQLREKAPGKVKSRKSCTVVPNERICGRYVIHFRFDESPNGLLDRESEDSFGKERQRPRNWGLRPRSCGLTRIDLLSEGIKLISCIAEPTLNIGRTKVNQEKQSRAEKNSLHTHAYIRGTQRTEKKYSR